MDRRVQALWGRVREHLGNQGFQRGIGEGKQTMLAALKMKVQEGKRKPRKSGTKSNVRTSTRMSRGRRGTNTQKPLVTETYKFDLSKPAFQPADQDTGPPTPEDKLATVIYDWADQHTITWTETIYGPKGGELPPGKCNMYLFPIVNFAASAGGVTKTVGGKRLEILCLIIEKVAEASGFKSRDSASAPPICSLIIANNQPSLDLAMLLLEANPRMLTHQHGEGPFTGEHAMHILVVNRKEDLFCRCLQLVTRIPRDERAILMGAQTTGGFFSGPPMIYYGSSILAYAAAFGLKRAVWMMVTDPQLSLDLNARPCGVSGFYPLHAAVVNGQTEMYDFLTDPNGSESGQQRPSDDDSSGFDDNGGSLHLPLQLLADSKKTTAIAAKPNLSQLTCLQLAALFGNQQMFTHIVRKQAQVRWMWGPLACFAIDATEVVKAAGVVTRLDSSAATQSLLLDSCLEGLMHSLLMKKWRTFARKVYVTYQILGTTYLALLFSLGFILKEWPDEIGPSLRLSLPLLTITCVMLLAAFDYISVRKWCKKNAAVGKLPIKLLLGFLGQIDIWSKLRSYVMALAAVSLLISGSFDDHDAKGTKDRWIWMLLALAIFSQASSLMKGLFVSHQRLGILALVVNKMLATDVLDYLLFLLLYLIKYWVTLYMIYPRAGDGFLYQIKEFNTWYDSIKAMSDFALTGNKFSIKFDPDPLQTGSLPVLSYEQIIGFVLFSWYYIWCSVMLVILLVRLLMAMMTNTFNSVRVLAKRHWRLHFARCVLQMEMMSGAKEVKDSNFHEVVTAIKVVDGVFTFQLFNETASV